MIPKRCRTFETSKWRYKVKSRAGKCLLFRRMWRNWSRSWLRAAPVKPGDDGPVKPTGQHNLQKKKKKQGRPLRPLKTDALNTSAAPWKSVHKGNKQNRWPLLARAGLANSLCKYYGRKLVAYSRYSGWVIVRTWSSSNWLASDLTPPIMISAAAPNLQRFLLKTHLGFVAPVELLLQL